MTRISVPAELPAVETAIQAHHALVYRVAFRMVKNSADAEDVTQGVFLLLLRQLESYAKAKSARAWLARMTMNHAVSWMRSEERRRRREKSWASDARRILQGNENMSDDELKDAIQALPDELRVPVVLHYQEGFKYREIAEVCKCPEGTVARRISTAKERIKRRLAKGGAVVAAAGLESALHAEISITLPAGLAEKIVAATSREWARLAAAGAVTGTSVAVSAGKAIACKCGIALTLAVALTTGAWYGLERMIDAHGAEGVEPAQARAPLVPKHSPSSSPRVAARMGRKGTSHRAETGEPSVAPEEESPAVEEDRTAKGPLVRGWIRDPSGNAIAGARVAFASSPDGAADGDPVVTDANGYYELDWEKKSHTSGLKLLQDQPVLGEVFTKKAFDWTSKIATGGAGLVEDPELQVETGTFLAEPDARIVDLHEALRKVARAADEEKLFRAKLEMTREMQSSATDVKAREMADYAMQLNQTVALSGWMAAGNQCQSCHPAPVDGAAGSARSEDAGKCPASGKGFFVRAEADGYEPRSSDRLDLQATEPIEASFTLETARPLSGVVLSDRGEPLAGVEVAVTAYSAKGPVSSSASSVTSDENGRFVFTSLAKGTYSLRASLEGFLNCEVVAGTGGSAAFRLARSGSVYTTVFSEETGQPLEGYRVELHDSIGVAASAVTDAAGAVHVAGLGAGTHLVNTYRGGSSSQYSRASTEVQVVPGETATVRLTVASRGDVGGSVSVLGYDGAAGQLVVETVPLSGIRRGSTERKSSKVLDDGSFLIKNVPPGRYALTLGRSSAKGSTEILREQEILVSPGVETTRADFALDVRPAVAVDVTVLDETGLPLSGADVSLELPISRSASSMHRTDDSGRVGLSAPPAEYTLAARADGFAAFSQRVTVSSGGNEPRRVVLSREQDPSAPTVSLESLFAPESKIALARPTSLRGFLDLLRRLGLADIAISPDLEPGAADRVLSGTGGERFAQDILAEMLKSGGLRWRADGSRIVIERAP